MEENHVSYTRTLGEKETMLKVRDACKDKMAWDKYREAYQRAIRCDLSCVSDFPVQLDFELNGTCNYRCESCTYRIEHGEMAREEISIEKYKEIIDEGVEKGLGAVRLNYHNEPLLKRDIDEYVLYAKQRGVMDVYLSSNGSLLNEQMSEKLILAGLDRLQISIDAFTKETYEKLRPGGVYEKVVSNVIHFIGLRNKMGSALPTVRVNFVKQSENEDELEDFVSFWQSHGVDSIGVQDCSDWESEKEDSLYENVEFQCNMPFKQMVIRYTGEVLPCCMFFSEELVVGNVYDSSISELWKAAGVKELRELHSNSRDWKKNPVCMKCVKSLVNVSNV